DGIVGRRKSVLRRKKTQGKHVDIHFVIRIPSGYRVGGSFGYPIPGCLQKTPHVRQSVAREVQRRRWDAEDGPKRWKPGSREPGDQHRDGSREPDRGNPCAWMRILRTLRR